MVLSDIFSLSPMSLIISLVIAAISTAYYSIRNRGLPPGPIGLPLLGYWPFMNNKNCHLRLNEMKEKYGDIFSFRITGCLFINLGSLRAIREAHLTQSECFNERLSKFSLLSHVFEEGIGFIYGDPWNDVRKFFLQVFKRRLADTLKTNAAEALYESIKSTIDDLKTKEDQPVNITEILIHKCSTNLRLILFDEFGISEDDIRKIVELYLTELSFMTPMNMLLSGNISKYFIFPLMPEYHKAMKCHKKMEILLYKMISDHKSTYNKDNIRDMIDEYFVERDKRADEGDPSAQYFTDKTLMASLIQFVGDGVHSVASFIGMLAKSLTDHPEEQEKIFEEIRDVIGLDRQPTIEDRRNLTYFNAFIDESMRTADFFNFFPSLECTRETTLSGYRIPKGANTLVNFYSAHNDPEVYEEPEKFNPSRFIKVNGKRREELPIPFGVGKRACLGENFTMTQVFLLLSTIVQNFHLSLANNSNPSYEQFLKGKLFIFVEPRNHSS